MKKEIRITDQKRGIVQVTVADERWYMREKRNRDTGLPESFLAVPSVTWIAHHYPKGIGYMKWLGDHGWDEAQALMREAGDKGSKVHEAISAILNGEEVKIDSKFINKSNGREEELTLEEVDCIKSFVDWRSTLPSFEPLVWDLTVFSEQHNYAGTIDMIARINGELYLVDFKTSQNIWPSFEMQVSAYREAVINGENPIMVKNENGTEKNLDVSGMKMAVLQIGFQRNRNGYRFVDIEDKFKLFLAAQQIWAHETEGQSPKVKDYPLVLAAGRPKEIFEIEPEDELIEVDGELPDDMELEEVKEGTFKPKKKVKK